MSVVPSYLGPQSHQGMVRLASVPEAIAALSECALACQACAVACRADRQSHLLGRLAREAADCAAICGATGSVLARNGEPNWRVIQMQLSACIAACTGTIAECDAWAADRPHFGVSASRCHVALRLCEQVRAEIRAPSMVWLRRA